jgi:hypothetical protein
MRHSIRNVDGRKAYDEGGRLNSRLRPEATKQDYDGMRSCMAGVGATAGQRDVPTGRVRSVRVARGRSPGDDPVDDAAAFGYRRVRKAMAYALLGIVGICAAGAEERQAVKAVEAMEFHIPAQPLASALQAYGQRTGIQVLYESNSAVGRSSVAVDGVFKPDAALDLLLTGTELRVKYIRPDAITLAPRSADRGGLSPMPAAADLSLGTLRVRGTTDGNDTARLQDFIETVHKGPCRKAAGRGPEATAPVRELRRRYRSMRRR